MTQAVYSSQGISLNQDSPFVSDYFSLKEGMRRFFYTKSSLDQKIGSLKQVLDIQAKLKKDFLSRYDNSETKALLERNWQKILSQACTNAELDAHDQSTYSSPSKVEKLQKELFEVIAGVEPIGISPYTSKELIRGEDIKNAIKYLLLDIDLNSTILNKKIFKAIFIKKDHAYLQKARSEFQMILFRILEKIQTDEYNEEIVSMLIGHLLSIYCYTDPAHGQVLSVPQKIDGSWQAVDCFLEKIQLTPNYLGSPISAFGLKPATNKGTAFLLFRGTTYPQDDGFLNTIIADFKPFHSVGGSLYEKHVKDKIIPWVEEANRRYNTKVKLFGLSLGAAISYHLGLDKPDLVDIYGYVPPGLLSRRIKKQQQPLSGRFYCHENDFVHLLGKHPNGLDFYKVITSSKRNKFTAHNRCYGTEDTILLKVNLEAENKRSIRIKLEIAHQIFSAFVYIPFQIVRFINTFIINPIKHCFNSVF